MEAGSTLVMDCSTAFQASKWKMEILRNIWVRAKSYPVLSPYRGVDCIKYNSSFLKG